jgi:hypothetical protein
MMDLKERDIIAFGDFLACLHGGPPGGSHFQVQEGRRPRKAYYISSV